MRECDMNKAEWPTVNSKDKRKCFELRPKNFNPPKCNSCIHFYPLSFERLQLSKRDGECRARGIIKNYSEVFIYDWCGEHQTK